MPKSVSATEAKVHLGSMINWTVEHGDEVIIEAHRQPKAVLIGYEEYQHIQRLRERIRRQEALARLEALAGQVSARNPDLTQEQADALADRFGREVIEEMVLEGKVSYKGR